MLFICRPFNSHNSIFSIEASCIKYCDLVNPHPPYLHLRIMLNTYWTPLNLRSHISTFVVLILCTNNLTHMHNFDKHLTTHLQNNRYVSQVFSGKHDCLAKHENQ